MQRFALMVLCGAAMALLATVGRAESPWKIPNPQKLTHPAASVPTASPLTYDGEKAFAQRAQTILKGVATEDLSRFRKGWFAGTGGDANKYVPGPCMARLLLNPKDPVALKYMNDERIRRKPGHYHFASVNWGRFFPIFEGALLPDVREIVIKDGFKSGSYLSPSGTENHKTMWMTTANVLPHFFDAGLARRSKADTLKRAKEMLRKYVRGLYQAGQGEWDSSTYLVYDVNGMLNIYDFSPDPECRLLAAAALDWYIAAYALKHRNGVYTAPNQRGYAKGPHSKSIDRVGWLWWGSTATVTPEWTKGWRTTLHAITSSWRPNKVITNIATKNVATLPVEQRNTKPNYWYGQGIPYKAGQTHETVFLSKRFTMGSMWDSHRSQLTRFQIAAAIDDWTVTFTGGHARKSDHTGKKTGAGLFDGTGRYVQSAQVGSTYLSMAKVPSDDELDFTFFLVPKNAKVRKVGEWTVLTAGKTAVAVRPIADKAEYTTVDGGRKAGKLNAIKFPGRQSGFLVEVADDATDPPAAQLPAALAKTRIDTTRWAKDMTLTYTNVQGKAIRMAFQPAPSGDEHGSRAADVEVDGKKVDLASWPIYSGPYVTQTPGMLTVSDGRDGYTIDFTGDMPVYKPHAVK